MNLHALRWVVSIILVLVSGVSPLQDRRKDVLIFHLIDNPLWGEVDGSGIHGDFSCSSPLIRRCAMFTSDEWDANDVSKRSLVSHLQKKYQTAISGVDIMRTITVSMYHIHTWKALASAPYSPNKEVFPTMLTMVESEESHHRFQRLFTTSFPHFDGNSTTSPFASVQRTYFRGWNLSDFHPMRPFQQLINGAAFVASTCHSGDGNNKRMHHVKQLQRYFRVDGLGKCLHTKHIAEGISLQFGRTEAEKLILKRRAISNYKFYLAFENTDERGYVTEKVFDALLAGVIPVYLGSQIDCQELMPAANAVIYVADFNYDMERLGAYLTYLSQNETAYEERRSWRHSFQLQKQSPLLTESWPCRLCNWAEKTFDRNGGK